MNRIVVAVLCALLVCAVSHAAGAQVVHIQFDTFANGTTIPSGTAMNTVFSAAYGVTFDAVRCPSCGADSNVYAVGSCRSDLSISPPNVVSLWGNDNCSPISEYLGQVRATFAAPADSVCIHVLPVRSQDMSVLRAYDAMGVEIATAYSTRGATQDLCVHAPGIFRVAFSGESLSYAWFDNLAVRMVGITPTRQGTWGALKSIYR